MYNFYEGRDIIDLVMLYKETVHVSLTFSDWKVLEISQFSMITIPVMKVDLYFNRKISKLSNEKRTFKFTWTEWLVLFL